MFTPALLILQLGTVVRKKWHPVQKNKPRQLIKIFNKNSSNHLFISNRMYLCLTDENKATSSSELKKLTGSQKLQIANGNEKLDTMLSQVNAPENSWQQIANAHRGFQLLTSIITERFDNTLKINPTIISEKRVKKSVKKRQHKIKQTNYRPIFKETIKSKKTKKR